MSNYKDPLFLPVQQNRMYDTLIYIIHLFNPNITLHYLYKSNMHFTRILSLYTGYISTHFPPSHP